MYKDLASFFKAECCVHETSSGLANFLTLLKTISSLPHKCLLDRHTLLLLAQNPTGCQRFDKYRKAEKIKQSMRCDTGTVQVHLSRTSHCKLQHATLIAKRAF